MNLDTKVLRFIAFNAVAPLVLRKFSKWKCVDWDLQKWQDVFGEEVLEFRCGTNEFTQIPQWERDTEKINGIFNDFLEFEDVKKWLYYDYKYLKECLLEVTELREAVRFDDYGLTTLSPDDATIWIGSKGAHTPCHIDTYGCNLVTQVYGSKQWLLFPPNENLKPTRVPYEESSVYSKLNFFSPPDLNEFSDLIGCKKVVLTAGDVLIVPHKWWHYVESLDVSISINTWIPLPTDDSERLNEAIVQMLISQISSGSTDEEKKILLNPNSDGIEHVTIDKSLALMNHLKKQVREYRKHDSVNPLSGQNPNIDLLIKRYDFISEPEELSLDAFSAILQLQMEQRPKANLLESPDVTEGQKEVGLVDIIDAVTHPSVLSLIRNKLFN